jgi:putative spermidine/putrescine transport system substrate-binding protein
LSRFRSHPAWAPFLIVVGFAVFMLAFAGCGGDDDDGGDSSEAATEVGEPEGELNIIAWAGYAEDGSTDPAVDWVTPFEKETGCQVNVKTGNTSDEMVTLMRTGEYDGVSASGDASGRLIEGGDVDPVNVDLVSNYADIFPALKDQPWNTVDGVNYGIPHGRGSNLLMWNTESVKPAPTSWSAVFDEAELAKQKGHVTAYDNPIYIADAALYLKAHNPELGIENVYELDQEQFDAAIDLLKTQNEFIGEYWSDYTKEIAAFANGDSTVGTTWQVITNLAQDEGVPVENVLPEEGATGWSDTWMLSSEAKNPNCMYLWMNHIVSPQTNAEVAEWFGEAPANQKSCALTENKDHCDVFHADDEDFFGKIAYWETPTKDCRDDRGDECKTYDEWVQGFTEVKG